MGWGAAAGEGLLSGNVGQVLRWRAQSRVRNSPCLHRRRIVISCDADLLCGVMPKAHLAHDGQMRRSQKLKYRFVFLIFAVTPILWGCSSYDRISSIEELKSSCEIRDGDINFSRAEINTSSKMGEKIIALGVISGAAYLRHGKCISNFRSSSGYVFRFGLNRPFI